MNTKFIRILATNALLAATLATTLTVAAGCKARRSQVTMIPTSETPAIVTETTAQEPAAATNAVEQLETIAFDMGEPATTEASATQTTAAKKTAAKQATKTVKKTTKKATKKTSKKSTKKAAKKTSQKQEEYYTYGKSKYVRDYYSVIMNVNKDDTAKIRIDRTEVDDDGTIWKASWFINGKIDRKEGRILYSNATKKMYKITSKAKQVNTSYTNGTGRLDFYGSYLRWSDSRGREAINLKITKI